MTRNEWNKTWVDAFKFCPPDGELVYAVSVDQRRVAQGIFPGKITLMKIVDGKWMTEDGRRVYEGTLPTHWQPKYSEKNEDDS